MALVFNRLECLLSIFISHDGDEAQSDDECRFLSFSTFSIFSSDRSLHMKQFFFLPTGKTNIPDNKIVIPVM